MIFWFSGTGNSRWVAEQLARQLNDRLISIADAISAAEYRYTIAADERLGFVFPIHSWGPAPIVLRFIKQMHIDGYSTSTYTWMACTCGDECGHAVVLWQKALGRITGNAAFSVQMPNTYICLPGFDVDAPDVVTRKLAAAEPRVEHIALSIAQRRCAIDVVEGPKATLKSRVVYPLFKHYGHSDRAFKVNTAVCTRCGTCVKACPVGNVAIDESGTPRWHHRCELCLACIHACPQRAIERGTATVKKSRYHLPNKYKQ